MPHVVILYSANLDAEADMSGFCRAAADALLTVHDEAGKPVFPTGGVRALAYPAPHFAVADGSDREFGFVYVQLRMGRGRSAAVHQATGEALSAAARTHFADLLGRLVQVAGPGVVAKPGPVVQHLVDGGIGQRHHIGEARHKTLVIGDHGGDLSLLQHDL